MVKKSFYFILSLMISAGVFSIIYCESEKPAIIKSDAESMGYKGKVKTVKEASYYSLGDSKPKIEEINIWKYDEKGNKLFYSREEWGPDYLKRFRFEYAYADGRKKSLKHIVTYLNNSEKEAGHTEYSYRTDGLLNSEKTYSCDNEKNDWELESQHIYDYDNKGNLLKDTYNEIKKDANSRVSMLGLSFDSVTEFEYDGNGKVKSETETRAGREPFHRTRTVYEYNDAGDIKKETFDVDGTVSVTEYEYFKGLLTRTVEFYTEYQKKHQTVKLYEYDKAGNLKREITVYLNDEYVETRSVTAEEYSYDSKGNITKKQDQYWFTDTTHDVPYEEFDPAKCKFLLNSRYKIIKFEYWK